MLEYIVYAAVWLIVVLPATIWGVSQADERSHLYFSDPSQGYSSLYSYKALPRISLLNNKIATLPAVISGLLTGLIVFGLVQAGILQLRVINLILSVIGLAVAGVVVGFCTTYLYAVLLFRINPDRQKEVDKFKKAMERAHGEIERKERRQGTPTTKVYRCGVCGLTSSNGQYVGFEGMTLCIEHGHIADRYPDIYECPSCGYKFLPGFNRDYYENHRCSHCGRHLDESSWD